MKTFKYTNLAANATTLIKTGSGFLHSIVINTAGASANTIVVYDSLTAANAKIASINGTATAGQTMLYDINFSIGLTLILATGTAADITVCWE